MAGEGGRPRDRGRRRPKGSGPPATRNAAVKVRSARRRKPSSTEWLSRQLNDPYVAEAQRLGYRSRAAFKLIELDDRFRLLRPGRRVVDLLTKWPAPGPRVSRSADRFALFPPNSACLHPRIGTAA